MRNVSLERALSKLGVTSRSQAGHIVREGRVTVNGRVIRNPAFRCDLRTDVIRVDEQDIETKKSIIIMLNKPRGVVTTRSDERGRPSIYSLLGEIRDWVFPVGRLDKESEGLLLCTNDNALGEALTGPDHRVPKVYRVGITCALSEEDKTLFERGMMLDGEKLRPVRIGLQGESAEGFWFDITLYEGKNRQIRRMCASRGIGVRSLKRVSVGPISLGSLRTGTFRRLTAREETLLRALTARSRESRSNTRRHGT